MILHVLGRIICINLPVCFQNVLFCHYRLNVTVRIWNYILSGNSNNYIYAGETLRIEKFALQLKWKDPKRTFRWLVTKQLIKMYGIFMRSLVWLWRTVSRPLTAFLQIIIVPQLLDELLACYGPRRFITMFTRATTFPVLSLKNPLSFILSWSFRSSLIHSSLLRLGLHCGLFPSDFSTKFLYAFVTKVYKNSKLEAFKFTKIYFGRNI